MDLLFILLVAGAVVATVIGYVIWIVFFVWAVKKGVDAMQENMNHAQRVNETSPMPSTPIGIQGMTGSLPMGSNPGSGNASIKEIVDLQVEAARPPYHWQ